jgi:REP-associated tyrosine transposase
MTYYERNLPHWLPEGKTVFLTWRLHGSLPATFLRRLKENSRTRAGRKFRETDVRRPQDWRWSSARKQGCSS